MNPLCLSLRRFALLLCLCASVPFLASCVDRRIYITSEPPGARVYLNDIDVGVTPAEVNFTYFGVYDVRLRKDGYEPLITSAEAKAPLHEQPVIDFFALLVPGEKRTEIRWHFDLEEAVNDPDALLERAAEMRERTVNIEDEDDAEE
ncbi:MAG: PEGA domain-containing protein [Planctomycetota bacterium]